MRKIFLSGIFLVMLALSAVFIPALADEDLGFVSVTERQTKEVLPNKASVSIVVESYGESAQKASDANKKVSQNVYAALKKVLTQSDSIKTGDYAVSPQYIYTKDNKRVLDKYLVRNSFLVSVVNVKSVSKIIDVAISNGANKVDDLNFSADNYDSVCTATLEELTKQAKTKANSIASSVGAKVVGIKSITTSCNQQYSPRNFYAMAKSVGDSESSETIIESGKIKIDVVVDASFYVK